MGRSIHWAILAGATVALGACDRATFDHESNRQTESGTARYPNCLKDMYDYYPGARNCDSGGRGAGDLCASCLCHESCQSDEDCAAPAGTAATGRCVGGSCVLDCATGTSCPEGMACTTVHMATGSGEICPDGTPCVPDQEMDVCMWALDDPLVCYGGGVAGGGNDPCGELHNRSTCEGVISVNPDLRCAWVEETILAAGVETCEPAEVLDRCIALERRNSCETAGCGPEGPSAYWTDLGAGTVSLIVLEDCEWQPMPRGPEEGIEACDFSSSVGLPLVCECACSSDSDGASTDGM